MRIFQLQRMAAHPLLRIVAPKVAGSNSVGHPLEIDTMVLWCGLLPSTLKNYQ
jgi:hypothetical protein